MQKHTHTLLLKSATFCSCTRGIFRNFPATNLHPAKAAWRFGGSGGPGCSERGRAALGSRLDWSGCSSQGNIKQDGGLKSASPPGRSPRRMGRGGYEASPLSLSLPPSLCCCVHRLDSVLLSLPPPRAICSSRSVSVSLDEPFQFLKTYF